jgi:hypothetical protein
VQGDGADCPPAKVPKVAGHHYPAIIHPTIAPSPACSVGASPSEDASKRARVSTADSAPAGAPTASSSSSARQSPAASSTPLPLPASDARLPRPVVREVGTKSKTRWDASPRASSSTGAAASGSAPAATAAVDAAVASDHSPVSSAVPSTPADPIPLSARVTSSGTSSARLQHDVAPTAIARPLAGRPRRSVRWFPPRKERE